MSRPPFVVCPDPAALMALPMFRKFAGEVAARSVELPATIRDRVELRADEDRDATAGPPRLSHPSSDASPHGTSTTPPRPAARPPRAARPGG